MKIYIAGKIAGDRRYRAKFREAAKAMEAAGHVVLNPATLPDGLTDGDYMRICMAMGYGWGRVLDYIGIGWEDDLFDREDQKPLCEECVERLKKDFTLEGPEEAPHKGTCWACRRKRKVVNRFAVEEVQG